MLVVLEHMLLLLLGTTHLHKGSSTRLTLPQGLVCGQKVYRRDSWYFNGFLSRIVGGYQVEEGANPWQVSLKRRNQHFCGGTLVSNQWVITAAHCVESRSLLNLLTVTAGEYDLTLKDEGEQTLPVKYIIKHPRFNKRKPMDYDIALLKMDGRFKYSPSVSPVCLPSQNEKFNPGSVCVTSGWGRLKENGILPEVLHEVKLPILHQTECSRILSTLKKPIHSQTIMCAGFPDGGKDACQGDSGGSLVCRRGYGSWTLIGVTSWGIGCARSWMNNLNRKYTQRGTPGIFTELTKVLPWIHQHLDTDVKMKSSRASCSVQDGKLSGSEENLTFPEYPKRFYEDNQLCIWTLLVPEGKHILLNFSNFDVEPDIFCDFDSLSVISMSDRLIGKFCGMDLPLPILIGSNSVRLKFVSDNKDQGTGFAMTYKAVDPANLKDSGCDSIAILYEEGTVQSMHYPESYSNLADCQWIVQAPENNVVKLVYDSFELEENEDCTYDSVTIYENNTMENKIAQSCGSAIPAPILSSSNTMFIHFYSDETETFGGFKARVMFIDIGDLNITDSSSEVVIFEHIDEATNVTKMRANSCGLASNQPKFLFSRIVGGEEAVPHSWPWQASLQILDINFCGGAVITPTWILTAAHCFKDVEKLQELWRVVVGAHVINIQEPSSQKRLVKQYIPHPKFNRITMDSDIALMQLDEPLEFNHYVQPVCLPKKDEKMNPARICVISGWGIQNEGGDSATKLHQLQVPILDSEQCKKYYKQFPSRINKNMFCAGYPEEGDKDGCTGDSGGPLVCPAEDGNYYTLNGVISWGFGCGRKTFPGVYANVAAFIEWIVQHIHGETN